MTLYLSASSAHQHPLGPNRFASLCRSLAIEALEDRTLLSGTMIGLGDLPGGEYYSLARNMSADGSVIVGFSDSEHGRQAFRWTEQTGMVGLGDLLGGEFYSEARGISKDGSVIVGYSISANGPEAFRWTAETGMVGLGDLPGGIFNSRALNASADGSVITGYGRSDNGIEAFVWTADSGMIGLGDLSGGIFDSRAQATSADGSIIVGAGHSANGPEAFIWTEETGIVGLGDLPGGTFKSRAMGVSADGTVIVGEATSSSGREPMVWTAQSGMVGLGFLSSSHNLATAWGVSPNGSYVAGSTGTDSLSEAFIWSADSGMTALGYLPGGDFSRVYGVSDDGSVAAGRSHYNGITEAVRWTADNTGALAIDDVSQTEGDAGSSQFLFTVTRTGDTSAPISVDWATADGTAVAGLDYLAGSGTLDFAAGVTQRTISVTVLGDTVLEADEEFFVNLSGSTGDVVIVDNQGIGTIENDELPPTLSINDVTAFEGQSGSTEFVFTVSRQGSTTGEVTVDYSTAASGELVPGGISTSADGAISVFAADIDGDGDTDAVSAAWNDNAIVWYENDGAQNFTAHTVTTSANLATSVWAADVNGDGHMDLLSSSWNDDTIAWYENNGNQNFTKRTISTTATNAWMASSADVNGDGHMDVLAASFGNDTIAWYENDGNQNFTLRNVSTSADGATWVMATDLDDDGDIDLLSTSREDDTVAWYENDGEENFTTHTISTSADGAYSLTVMDVDGDGDADVVSASANDDKLAWYENDGAGNFIATHTITTTADAARAVFAADMDSDGDADLLYASFDDDTIGWYESGHATADVDFAATSGTLTFGDGVSEQTITVSVFGDAIIESDETFSITLSNAVGATIDDGEGIGTIQNDDPSAGGPTIAISDNSGSNDDASLQFTTALSQFRAGASDSLWVRPGMADTLHYIDITNYGAGVLTLFEITINAPDVTADVVLNDDAADDIQLAPGETQRVNLTYAPTQPTASNPASQDFLSANGLVIHSDAENAATYTVSLQGKSTFASDVNYDGSVNFGDLGIFNNNFGLTSASPNWDPTADMNGDGAVNFGDLGQFNAQFGMTLGATFTGETTVTKTPNTTESHDGLFIALLEDGDLLLEESNHARTTEATRLIAPETSTPALYEEPPTTSEHEAVFEEFGGSSEEETLTDLFEFNNALADDLALV